MGPKVQCPRVSWAWCRTCCWWLLLNLVFLRPVFTLINLVALGSWKCPMPDGDSGGNLQVIVMGFGRTGTTSMMHALRKLGLKGYKSMDSNFYLHELIDRFDQMSTEEVAFRVRMCGLGAISLETFPVLLPTLLKAFPGVKVVLLMRDWQSWVKSEGRRGGSRHFPAVFRLASHSFCHWLPYVAIWPTVGFGDAFYEDSITSTLLASCFLELDWIPLRSRWLEFGAYERNALSNETVFKEYYDNVRNHVPAGDLLEFDITRHGWGELTGFLGRPKPEPFETFPWLNHDTSAYQYTKATLFPLHVCLFWALMLFSVLINWLTSLAATWLLRRCWAGSFASSVGSKKNL